MAIQVTFQLDSPRERADVLKCINSLDANQITYGNKSMQISSGSQAVDNSEYLSKIKELERKNKDLQEDIDKYSKQTAKDAKIIANLQQENKVLNQDNVIKIKDAEDAMKLAEEADKKAKTVKEDCEQRLKRQTDHYNDEVKRLKNAHYDEIAKLNDRIRELKIQMENFNPSLSLNMNSEQMYFNVDGNILTRTNSADAEYIAQCSNDNRYKFQFNWQKGPIREACAKRKEKILPFCDIKDGMDLVDVGRIEPGKWGEAIMKGDDLEVIVKAELILLKD
ncbi:MAG: hypothetical protein K6G32_02810 [Prevotella sp.]|nr:hypothetical protein [Prevotella sp.]